MLNPKGIVFTGGEPIMRKDLIELLHYARTNFKGQIILSTNTLLITEKNINSILENITGISISLDGYDQNSCEIVNEFIKKIIVHALEKVDGKRVQKVDIIFNFVGEINFLSATQPKRQGA